MSKVLDIRTGKGLEGHIKDQTLYAYKDPSNETGFIWSEKDKIESALVGDQFVYPLFQGNMVHIKPFIPPDCGHRNVELCVDGVYRCTKCDRDLKPNWSPK